MCVFDMKKEGKKIKSRQVVGGHVINTSSLPTCSSVVQNLSIRLLLLISKANNLHIATGHVGNAHFNANVGKSACARAGEE